MSTRGLHTPGQQIDPLAYASASVTPTTWGPATPTEVHAGSPAGAIREAETVRQSDLQRAARAAREAQAAQARGCPRCRRMADPADDFCTGCGSLYVPVGPAPARATPGGPRAGSGRFATVFLAAIVAGLIAGAGFVGFRHVTAERRLDQDYTAAVVSADRQEWDRAAAGFEQVVKDRAGYKDAQRRLDAARKQLRLQQQYQAAMASFQASDWAEAARQLETLAAESPSYRDAPARLAEAHRELRLAGAYDSAVGKLRASAWTDAVRELETIAAEAPSYRDVGARLAEARREAQLLQLYEAAMGRYQAAAWPDTVQQLEALAKQAPTYRDVAARLAEARRQLGLERQYEEGTSRLAAKDYENAIKTLAAVAGSDYSGAGNAKADLTRARQEYAEELTGQADAAYKGSRWPEVERLAKLAITQDPQVRYAHRLLGFALQQMGRWPEAREAYAQATRVDPRDAVAYNLLGYAHLNSSGGDMAAAEVAFRRAVDADPKLANAHAGLGHVLAETGRPAEARDAFRRALAIDPDHGSSYQGLGWIALREGDYASAETSFRGAVQRNPRVLVYRLDLSLALMLQKQYDATKKELDQAKALSPESPDVDFLLGRYYRETRQLQFSLNAYDTGLSRNPRDPWAQYGRGLTLLEMGRNEEAAAAGARAAELGAVSDGKAVQALALLRMGRRAEARAAAQASLQVNPNNPIAQDVMRQLGG